MMADNTKIRFITEEYSNWPVADKPGEAIMNGE
jgi:hypothetical protein